MAELGGAARDGVEDFQRRYQLACGIDLDGQAPAAHGVDAFGQAFGGGTQARVVLRPGGDHLPVIGLGGLAGRLLVGRLGLFVLAAGQGQRGEQGGGTEQMAAFHVVWMSLFLVGGLGQSASSLA